RRPLISSAISSSLRARRRLPRSWAGRCGLRRNLRPWRMAWRGTPWVLTPTPPPTLSPRAFLRSLRVATRRGPPPPGGRRGVTPCEMLAAFIVAAEVAARLFRAAPQGWRNTSWHGTGTIGTTAAAIASARLMKLPAEKIPDVVGITASMAGGLNVNFGTMTKPLHSGRAAQQGVLAAMLGARGFTASQSALEGPGGYFERFVQKWTLEPFADLGSRYDLAEMGYRLKAYPSGGLGHTAIDVALELRELVPLDDIARIDVAITNFAARRLTDKYPQTEESAKFSGPY